MSGCWQDGRLRRVDAIVLFDQAKLDFGEVPVGEWREAPTRVSNAGRAPFRLLEVLKLDDNPSFEVEAGTGMLGPGEERTVVVRFHPLAEGTLTDLLKLSTDADRDPERRLPLSGVGTPAPVQVYPERLNFETLELDSERWLEVTVENPVDLPLTVALEGTSAHQFDSDLSTVPSRSTSAVRVRYLPREVGPSEARLQVRACESCTPVGARLSGNSVPSAFSFDPSPVPFENVPVHERTRSSTRATNVTWRAVETLGLSTTDSSFLPLTDISGREVPPGSSLMVTIEFAARRSGPSEGTLWLAYRSDRDRSSEVLLDAKGGRPQLAIAPSSIEFSDLPVGGKSERLVRLSNAGTVGSLYFRGVRALGNVRDFKISPPMRGGLAFPWLPGSAWPDLRAADLPIAPGTDYLDLKVYFEPASPGPARVELVFLSDDLFHPERTIAVTGDAYPVGPCSFRVLPAGKLDFGNVPTGKGAVLGFRFENAGTNPCAVKDIHLSADGGGVFFMPGGALTGGVVLRDDSFAAQVAFKAKVDGRYAGELSITVNSPTTPVFKLPLEALAQASCLAAAPPYLDFGPVRYDCEPPPRHTFVQNRCPTPVTVERIWIGQGTSEQFRLESRPSVPLTLAPGEGFELEASYSRTVHGQHYSPLFVKAAAEPSPLLVPMLAETNHEGLMSERFVQGAAGQLDLLFVVGNTTTMQPFQDRMKAAVPGWLASAASLGVNLRLGVTTTGLIPRLASCPGGASGGEGGRLFPVDGSRPRVVSSASAGAAATLAQNLTVGACHNLVQGLEAMRAALSAPLIDSADDPRTFQPNDGNAGFLRATAPLAIVFLVDEDDHSGFDTEGYAQFVRSLKGPTMAHRVAAHALVPTDSSCETAGPPGPRFSDVARMTGGMVRSVCEPSYASFLDELVHRASGPQSEFRLSYRPSGATGISVRVNGAEAPSGSWSFDPAKNSIVFAAGSVPAPGSSIVVRYRSECGEPSP
ncbi:MAG: choice-of-anchor D domain-containing protein [Myxococcales bacterium]|nr:choice-of-anchor D domain-containing protein [Myxococcales bacterium]